MNIKTFADLDLDKSIQKALLAENYQTPTPIQAQAIPHLLQGRDVIGSAQTGTGKTAAFALPILHQLATKPRRAQTGTPRVLVLSPTRELALQIAESFKTYGQFVHYRQAVIYGGVSQHSQVRSLDRGVHVVVATPGRLIDLLDQGHVQLDQLEAFVLDEADRMLDMGFLPALKRIIRELPEERQSLFFSATLSPKIMELTKQLLNDPVTVSVDPPSSSVDMIDQRVAFVEHGGKRELLKNLLEAPDVERAVVFTKTKRSANTVAEKLLRQGIRATAIHGNKSQNARQRALDEFRRSRVKVLVATDVAARGLDVDGITHVVNFDLPLEPENYVHRIGRTGRAGAEGMAVSFCSAGERRELRAIERLIGRRLLMVNGEPQPENGPTSKDDRSGNRQGNPKSKPRRNRWQSSGPSKNNSAGNSAGKRKRRRVKSNNGERQNVKPKG
ncbi:DEAD/DEAH box helicase [Thalassoroseus pseudoceratinae]|uniref:DEAD/DEAH box helicase n=1 Tax=Thalassoroseus pseudoceratinae TaxID=2713176 RepID=UPI001F0EB984|nr:DEAD/DEAH box helicase [Thalassoroseus pseudoceratinae]